MYVCAHACVSKCIFFSRIGNIYKISKFLKTMEPLVIYLHEIPQSIFFCSFTKLKTKDNVGVLTIATIIYIFTFSECNTFRSFKSHVISPPMTAVSCQILFFFFFLPYPFSSTFSFLYSILYYRTFFYVLKAQGGTQD